LSSLSDDEVGELQRAIRAERAQRAEQSNWRGSQSYRGVIGLLGLVVGPVLVILTGHGGGLAERIALYPLIIWLIVFGFAILSQKVRTRKTLGIHTFWRDGSSGVRVRS
jgi:hypothetical protein